MEYRAPLSDLHFALKHIAEFDTVLAQGAHNDLSFSDVSSILEEAGKFAARDVAPVNRLSDEEGCKWSEVGVTVPHPFRGLLDAIRDGGWMSLPFEPQYGGQGLPYTLSIAFHELLASGCLAFDTCLCLSEGAIKALQAHAFEPLKETYLPRLISGEWTGTMCLTEPHAGTDVGAIRTKAEPAADGTYHISGTKIFITFGEHDLAENIIHLVLARLPGAPEGSKGISLFLVPKFLPDADGDFTLRNDVQCQAIEKKLGLAGSPTCVMGFGEQEGAVGYLVGEPNRGLAHMFTMMNVSRLQVGMQGVGIAERAYQHALKYAQDRTQGWSPNSSQSPAPIIAHEDVRRMLMRMKCQTEAARAICLRTAVAIDVARSAADEAERQKAKQLEQLLTPIAKSYSTDVGVEASSLAIQIHGGMGFVEETGVAQYYRDVRITPIYEGTNGVQALDLLFRKTVADGGAAMRAVIDEMRTVAEALESAGDMRLNRIAAQLTKGQQSLAEALAYLLTISSTNHGAASAAATVFQELFAKTYGHYLLARGALAASDLRDAESEFSAAKIQSAQFFGDHILLPATALLNTITSADAALPSEAQLVAAQTAHFAA